LKIIAFLLILIFIYGCGAGGERLSGSGSIDISKFSKISGNNIESVINVFGVISGKTGPFLSPSMVYPESGLKITLAWKGGEIVIPLRAKNTFSIAGIKRMSDDYVLRIYKNSTLFADIPISLSDYQDQSDIMLMPEILIDSVLERSIMTLLTKKNLGSNFDYRVQLIVRKIISKTSALNFSILSTGNYNELRNNGIIEYYEDTGFKKFDIPGDVFDEMVLKKRADGEQYTLSGDYSADSNDPFYSDRNAILNELTFSDDNLSATSMKVFLGDEKDKNQNIINVSSPFYATISFYNIKDDLVSLQDFYMEISAKSSLGTVTKKAFFSHGTAYREDGTSISNINFENGKYYLYYSNLENMGITSSENVEFTVNISMADGTIINSKLTKTFQ